jgi:hypothetical protein
MGLVPRFPIRQGLLGRRCLDLGLGILTEANLLLRCKPICLLELLQRVARLAGPRAAAACEDGKRKDAGEEINAKTQGKKKKVVDLAQRSGCLEEINAKAQGRKDAREEKQEGSGSRAEIRMVGFLCFLAD